MAAETITPNIGLQIPAFNQGNWQVPINYDLELLDKIFGGEITVPALSVTDFEIANIGAVLLGVFVTEIPEGTKPGSVFNLSFVPVLIFGVYINGVFQRPGGLDYNQSGTVLTLNKTVGATDNVYAVYIKVGS